MELTSGVLTVLVLFRCSGSTSRRVVWSIIVIVIIFIGTVVLAILDSCSCKLTRLVWIYYLICLCACIFRAIFSQKVAVACPTV